MTALALAGVERSPCGPLEDLAAGTRRGPTVAPDLVLPPGFDRIGDVVRFEQDSGPDRERAATTAVAPVATPAPAGEGQEPALFANDVDEPLPTLNRCHGRSKTLPNTRLSRAEVRAGRLIVYPDVDRPRTRGDCEGGARPCPFVSCRYHLFLDVDQVSGAVKLNFPEREPDELAETCALDVADRGGATLEMTADYVNLTRERIRQVEVAALKHARVRNMDAAAQLDGADIRSGTGLGQSPWMSGEGSW